jgi:hypothetical protein
MHRPNLYRKISREEIKLENFGLCGRGNAKIITIQFCKVESNDVFLSVNVIINFEVP